MHLPHKDHWGPGHLMLPLSTRQRTSLGWAWPALRCCATCRVSKSPNTRRELTRPLTSSVQTCTSAQAASAAAIRGSTPAIADTPRSARNSETNRKTPGSTRQSSRAPSPAISKSSSKSSTSTQKEMKTDVSEVKPGVLVNVCKPAPRAENARQDGEDGGKGPSKSPSLPRTPAEGLHAFINGCNEQLQALESQVTALDKYVELLNGQLQISRERRDHDHAERLLLLAAKDSLEAQVLCMQDLCLKLSVNVTRRLTRCCPSRNAGAAAFSTI